MDSSEKFYDGDKVWVLCCNAENLTNPTDLFIPPYHKPVFDYGSQRNGGGAIWYWIQFEVKEVGMADIRTKHPFGPAYWGIPILDFSDRKHTCYKDSSLCPGHWSFWENDKLVKTPSSQKYATAYEAPTEKRKTPEWGLPVNTTECECGAWAVNGGHSPWCRLFRK